MEWEHRSGSGVMEWPPVRGDSLQNADLDQPLAPPSSATNAAALGAPTVRPRTASPRPVVQNQDISVSPAAAPENSETNLTIARRQRERGENPSRDPSAKNPDSSASGPDQMIDGTFLDVMNKHFPEMVQGKSRQEVLAMKSDAKISGDASSAYDQDNAKFLASNGIAPTPNFINAAYRAGPQGAMAIIQAARTNPGALVKDVAPDVGKPGNNGAGNLTVGQFLMNPYQRGHGTDNTGTPQQLYTLAKGNEILQQMLQEEESGKKKIADIDKDYKPLDIGKPPKPPETDPLKQFSSLAGVFATIAAGFSRTPAIAAMNGLAGAMDAAKKSDWQTYQAQYDQFKTNSELAIKAHEVHSADVKDALEMMTKNIAAGTAMIQGISSLSHDEEMSHHLALGDYIAMDDLRMRRDKTAQELKDNLPISLATAQLTAAMHHRDAAYQFGDQTAMAQADDLVKQYENRLAEVKRATSGGSAAGFASPQTVEVKQADGTTKTVLAQQERGTGQWVTADAARMPIQGQIVPAKEARDERREITGKITPEDAHQAAEQLIAGDKSVLQNLGRGTQGAENLALIRHEYTKIAEDRHISGADQAAINAAFQGAVAAARTLGSATARIDLGAQELSSLIPQAKETSSKVVRWGATPIDRLVQALMGATNDPELADFATTNQSVANAFSQVATRGGAPTEGARTHAYELLSTVRDDVSYNKVLDRLQKEADTIKGASKASQADIAKQIIANSRGGDFTPLSAATNLSGEKVPEAERSAAPKENDKGKSKSGRPITYRNGQWEYDNASTR